MSTLQHTEENYAKLFTFVSEFINKDEFVSKHKTDSKHFTRDRVWTFQRAFFFICSMLNKRVQTEIDDFLSKLHQIPIEIRQATSSSFTQCREKINYTAFSEANAALVKNYYDHYDIKRYYGHRLVAIDGSVYTLPKTKATVKEFGDNVLSENGKWIKAQVSFAADVLNNVCIDAVIGPYKESEVSQAIEHVSRLGENNLYLFDRGYFSREFLGQVSATGNQYCFRVQKNACREVIDFIKSNCRDKIGYIDVKGKKIKVRFTKIILDTGEEEYLVTSLFDRDFFTIEKLQALYHLRWGVEEQYKDMKYAICVENFIGRKPNSIKQEFFANILTYNISMMTLKPLIDIASNKEKKKKKKREYKTNKRAVLAKVKQCFVRIFLRVEENISEILNRIVYFVSKESVPVREGRKFERGKSKKAKKKSSRAYVPVI